MSSILAAILRLFGIETAEESKTEEVEQPVAQPVAQPAAEPVVEEEEESVAEPVVVVDEPEEPEPEEVSIDPLMVDYYAAVLGHSLIKGIPSNVDDVYCAKCIFDVLKTYNVMVELGYGRDYETEVAPLIEKYLDNEYYSPATVVKNSYRMEDILSTTYYDYMIMIRKHFNIEPRVYKNLPSNFPFINCKQELCNAVCMIVNSFIECYHIDHPYYVIKNYNIIGELNSGRTSEFPNEYTIPEMNRAIHDNPTKRLTDVLYDGIDNDNVSIPYFDIDIDDLVSTCYKLLGGQKIGNALCMITDNMIRAIYSSLIQPRLNWSLMFPIDWYSLAYAPDELQNVENFHTEIVNTDAKPLMPSIPAEGKDWWTTEKCKTISAESFNEVAKTAYTGMSTKDNDWFRPR